MSAERTEAVHPGVPTAIVEAAALWMAKLAHGEPTPRTRRAFAQWLAADPLHGLAWERMDSLRHGFAALPGALARDTLAAAHARRRGHGRRGALRLLGLGGLVLASGWLVRAHAPWQRVLADMSTGVGEQRQWRLADGTQVHLNTDSALSADLDGERRVLTLLRGEVLVSTGDDADAAARRPFWVHTPFGRMEALGTRFVVRLEPDRARVSVQEGMVALHPAGGGAPVLVRPGESRWLRETDAPVAPSRGFTEDGWVEGVIAGRGIRLDDLLAELARHRHGIVSCAPEVAGLRVSGVFHLRDSDQALRFLARTQPIAVRERTRYWVMVGPQGG